ncbi:ATP synthase subunit a [Alphaproteobacteria bacterium]|nr:ATP synthase subunit a [Alphaproteobacteria bacterium]
MSSPIEQFTIKPLIPWKVGGVDLSFTNAALTMTLAVVIVVAAYAICMRRRAVIPGTAQGVAELSYEFVDNMILSNIGPAGRVCFPYLLTVFLYVLLGNLLGLIPYSFTYTAQASVVGGLAVVGTLISTVLGLQRKGLHWFRLFLPEGTPWYTAPVMVPIEVISYLSRPFSLTVRLVANMMVGHIMLKVIAGFIVALGLAGGFVPGLFVLLLMVFEAGIACLQAYIFTVLSCIYLGDAFNSH